MNTNDLVNKTAQTNLRPRNIIISGTNFWNPGDDFVRDGVIRILKEIFAGEMLNFLFYNFNPDFFPNVRLFESSNIISNGDLEKYSDSVDAIIAVGVSAGHEVKDLYRWILANGLEEKVYLISGHYESGYCAEHISKEPEATIFRKARMVIGRTKKIPDFIRSEKIPYHHLNCPALLSVPEVKTITSGKSIQRIGFSIQLPPSLGGLVNQSCSEALYHLTVAVLRELSRQYQVEIVAHHKTEYFHFLNLLRREEIPVIFSSFYHHLFETYRRYDLVVTTRLHTSLLANGHGIPGIIINDTDRHIHALEGFPHSPRVNTHEDFEKVFAGWKQADLSVVAQEAADFKSKLLAQYVRVLRPAMTDKNNLSAIAVKKKSGLLENARRILFVRTDSIGDAVLASAMLEPIRKKCPNAKLVVLCQQHVAELFIACPFVDSIICYDRKKMDVASEREQIVSEIAAFNPDVILNSVRSRDRFSNELAQAFRAARHIAIEGDRDNISEADHAQSLGGYESLIPSPGTHKAELARHADFLRGLGIETKNLQPVAWTSPADETLADAFFQRQSLDPQKTIAVFPGAQNEIRVYHGYAEAMKKMDGFRFLIFGDAPQTNLAEKLGRRFPGRTINLCGRTSLREATALLRRCRLYIGAESAGAHIACAVGVPNVVVLGGGHFGRFMPYSPLTSSVSLPLDCFGCDWQCVYSTAHCINSLAPQVLAEAISTTLKGRSSKPRWFVQIDRSSANQELLSRLADSFLSRAVEIVTVPVEQLIPRAWPSLQYGPGVHKQENDFRWLDREAELQVTVPENGPRASLAFDLQADKMEWYPGGSLDVVVKVNGKIERRFVLQTDGQIQNVRLLLLPTAQPYSVHIICPQFFTGQGDSRRLTLQLRRVALVPEKKRTVGEGRQITGRIACVVQYEDQQAYDEHPSNSRFEDLIPKIG